MLKFQDFQRLDERISVNAVASELEAIKSSVDRVLDSQSDDVLNKRFKYNQFVRDFQSKTSREFKRVLRHIVDNEIDARGTGRSDFKFLVNNIIAKGGNVIGQLEIEVVSVGPNELEINDARLRIIVGEDILKSSLVNQESRDHLLSQIASAFAHEAFHVCQLIRSDDNFRYAEAGSKTFSGTKTFRNEQELWWGNYLATKAEINAHALQAAVDVDEAGRVDWALDNVASPSAYDEFEKITHEFQKYRNFFGPDKRSTDTGFEIWKRFIKNFVQNLQEIKETRDKLR